MLSLFSLSFVASRYPSWCVASCRRKRKTRYLFEMIKKNKSWIWWKVKIWIENETDVEQFGVFQTAQKGLQVRPQSALSTRSNYFHILYISIFLLNNTRASCAEFFIHHPEWARDPFISTHCAMLSSGWNETFHKTLGPFAAFFPLLRVRAQFTQVENRKKIIKISLPLVLALLELNKKKATR